MKTFLEWPPDSRQQTLEEHREQQHGEGGGDGGEAAVSLRVRVGSAAAAGHRVPINIRTVRRWRAGLRTHGPHPAIHPPYQTHLYCEDAAMPTLTISTHNRGAHTQFGARRTSSICFSDLLSQESAELE